LLHRMAGQAAPAESLPATADGAAFVPTSWSADGKSLAGTCAIAGGSRIVLYDFGSRSYTGVETVPEPLPYDGPFPTFLSDGKRLLYLTRDGVKLLDTRTRRSHVIATGSPENAIVRFAVSADDAFLYFNRQMSQADIWMASVP